MAPEIFLTGATGYIGGDTLYALYAAHPDYSYTALVRNSDKGAAVAAQYPSVRLVYGNLDDSALLEEEASKADIVIHTADSSDHEGAARAIAKGLAAGHTKENLGFWIHISGTGILTWKDVETSTFGEGPQPGTAYDDLDGVDRVTSLPDSAYHRNVDKVVLEAGIKNKDSVKTAIVCPPTIYGPGRGPDGTRSIQLPKLVEVTLKVKQPIQLGAGKTEWDNVHIKDLTQLFVLLAEAAVAKRLDSELWGEKGYYFAENGQHVWGELAKKVGEVSYKAGYIPTTEIKVLTLDEAKALGGDAALTWGLNSQGKALRARKFLRWAPTEKIEASLPALIESEAIRAGIKKGHAEKVVAK